MGLVGDEPEWAILWDGPSRERVGKAFLNEPAEREAYLWCLPVLEKLETPTPEGTVHIEERVNMVQAEDKDITSMAGRLEQEIELMDTEYHPAEDIGSMGSVSSDDSEEAVYIDRYRNPNDKERLRGDEWGTVWRMVLLPTGITANEYRRIGIAEMWNLDQICMYNCLTRFVDAIEILLQRLSICRKFGDSKR